MPRKDPEARRAYHREYMRKRYAQDAEHRVSHARKVRETKRRTKPKYQQVLAAFRENGCSVCPERDPACMDAHHVDDAKKDFGVANGNSVGFSVKRLRMELEKCICVCSNCHRKIHAGSIPAPELVAQPRVS